MLAFLKSNWKFLLAAAWATWATVQIHGIKAGHERVSDVVERNQYLLLDARDQARSTSSEVRHLREDTEAIRRKSEPYWFPVERHNRK